MYRKLNVFWKTTNKIRSRNNETNQVEILEMKNPTPELKNSTEIINIRLSQAGERIRELKNTIWNYSVIGTKRQNNKKESRKPTGILGHHQETKHSYNSSLERKEKGG